MNRPAARRSLRRRLLGIMLSTTLVALLVALAAVAAWDLREYHSRWTADMQTQAELLARTIAPALAFDDAAAATENLGLLQLRPGVQAAAIYPARGELFASYRRAV